jgi:hypothetical protein
MFSTEDEEYASCAACNREVSRADNVYAFEGDRVLCFGCSGRRHGIYQDLLERWSIAPDVDDLRPQPVQEADAECNVTCDAALGRGEVRLTKAIRDGS